MRETWRTRLTAAKRAAKPVVPERIDVQSDDGSVTTDLSTEPSPVATLTKAEKRARQKQANEEAPRKAADAAALREAEVEALRVRALEQEEEEAVDAAIAASLDTAEKEEALRKRREAAIAEHAALIVPSAAAVAAAIAAAIRVPAPPPQVVVPLSAIEAPSPQRPADAASTVATSLECVVCMASERSHVAVPCGHRVLCETCATKAKIKACPICRNLVQMWMMVWE